jgi:hypothetical protein
MLSTENEIINEMLYDSPSNMSLLIENDHFEDKKNEVRGFNGRILIFLCFICLLSGMINLTK